MSNLEPLEFKECAVDSPWFRDKLSLHEKEIENNVKIFKNISNSIKNVYKTLEDCSTAFVELADNLMKFTSNEDVNATEINSNHYETEDEKMIRCSVKIYSDMIKNVESMRKKNIFGNSKELVINDLQQLGDEFLSRTKRDIKDFKKTTAIYYGKLDRYSSIRYKPENEYNSIDAEFKQDRLLFVTKALQHVMTIQDTEEKRTSKLVHTLGLMMRTFSNYHHEAYDHLEDELVKIGEIEENVLRTMESYTSITTDTTRLMRHIVDMPIEEIQPDTEIEGEIRREGYLFVLTKKNLIPDAWVRKYCVYVKDSKKLFVYQTSQQFETYDVTSCEGKTMASSERRFSFDLKVNNQNSILTLQALTPEDMKLWIQIMDGKEPEYAPRRRSSAREACTFINEKCIKLISMCFSEIENRGIDCEGIYRLSGNALERDGLIQRFINDILDPSQDSMSADDLKEIDINTLASAVKAVIQRLKTPLATFKLYDKFMSVRKFSTPPERFNSLLLTIKQLPPDHYRLFSIVIKHLKNITQHVSNNRMSAANLAVCFGPTIFRPQEENSSVTAIRDSKFANDVLTILIENCNSIFTGSQLGNKTLSKSVTTLNPDKYNPKFADTLNKSFRERRPSNKHINDLPSLGSNSSENDNDNSWYNIDLTLREYIKQFISLISLSDLKAMLDITKKLRVLTYDCENYQKEVAETALESQFPEHLTTVMRRLNNKGVFTTDEIWFTTFYLYDLSNFFSKASFNFATELLQRGICSLLVLNISHKPYIERLSSNNTNFIVKTTLNIIRNMCHYSGNCSYFRGNSVKPSLRKLINQEDESIRIVATLCLAFLATEDDGLWLFGDENTLPKNDDEDLLLKLIEYVKMSRNTEYKGFRSFEFLEAIRAVTFTERERKHFVDLDGFRLLKEILVTSVLNDDIVECLQILFNVCNGRDFSLGLLNAGITDELVERFLNSDNATVKFAAQDYVWRLEMNRKVVPEIVPIDDTNDRTLYISYANVNQSMFTKIQGKLMETRLFKVIEPGNRSDPYSLKKTIRQSAVVIVCLSEAFKCQPRCRLEVEYSDRLSKRLVPLLIQQKYRPDGWLSELVSRKNNLFNLSSKIDFDQSWEPLVEYLGKQMEELRESAKTSGRETEPANNVRNDDEPVSTQLDIVRKQSNLFGSTGANYDCSIDPATSNTLWLEKNELGHLRGRLHWLDMKLLKYYQTMKVNAQDYFYQSLEKQLNLDLIDILKFSNAIDKL